MTRNLPISSGLAHQSPPGSQCFEFFLVLKHSRLPPQSSHLPFLYMYTFSPNPHSLKFQVSDLCHSPLYLPPALVKISTLLCALVSSEVFSCTILTTLELSNYLYKKCLSVFPIRPQTLLIHSYIPPNYHQPALNNFLTEYISIIIFSDL